MSGCVGRRDGSQFDLGVQKRDKLCRSGNASMLRRRLPGGTGPAGAVACLATSLYIKSKVEENRQAGKNQYSPDSGLIGTLSPSRLAGGVRLTSCRRERRLAKQLMTDILCALSWRQYTVALQTIHVFNVNTTVRTARMKEFELRTPLLPSCPLVRCQSDLGLVIGPAIVLRARDLGASSSDNSDLSRHARSRRLESQNDGGPRHAQDHLR